MSVSLTFTSLPGISKVYLDDCVNWSFFMEHLKNFTGKTETKEF